MKTGIASADSRTVSQGGSLLVLNAGSSSLKFALFSGNTAEDRVLSGKIDRIGLDGSALSLHAAGHDPLPRRPVDVADHTGAASIILSLLQDHGAADRILGVGHRVVHGGPRYVEPAEVTPDVLNELRRVSLFAPEHLPSAIMVMDFIAREFPDLPQLACFDTAFHRTLPPVARLLPIPRRYATRGVHRYGFHGLSFEYLMEELNRTAGPDGANGRIVLAHLGNGASLAAVREGRSIDTSMGFTPAAGIPMSTRSGDLDPGLVWYLAEQEGMTPKQFYTMVNRESGLLGLSETSPDMRDLLARENGDPRAAEAVAVFCYGVKKTIGAYAAALGGLDTVVFSGGIGENAAEIRARICEGLEFLGIQLDKTSNEAHATRISTPQSAVTVRVIRTDEERIILRALTRFLEWKKQHRSIPS